MSHALGARAALRAPHAPRRPVGGPPAARDAGSDGAATAGADRRGTALAAAFGTWLGAYSLPAWLGEEAAALTNELFYAGFLLIAALAYERSAREILSLRAAWRAVACLVAVVALSTAANLDGGRAEHVLVQGAVLASVLFAAMALVPSLARHPRHVLVPFAALTIASLGLAFVVEPPGEGERFGGILNPNNLGLLLASACCASFASRRLLPKLAALAVAVALIVATGSRSALIGLGLAVVVTGAGVGGAAGARTPLAVLARAGAAALVAGLAWLWDDRLLLDAADRLLALSDQYRGIHSGFTHRTKVWALGAEFWWQRPLLGHGPRTDEMLFAEYHLVNADGPGIYSAHSGWLAMLLDLGALGLAVYATIVARALRACWLAPRDDPSSDARLALVTACVFIAVFERVSLSGGHPVPLLFAAYVLAMNDPAAGGRRAPAKAAATAGRPAPAILRGPARAARP